MKTTQAALEVSTCVMAGSVFAQTNVTIGRLPAEFALTGFFRSDHR